MGDLSKVLENLGNFSEGFNPLAEILQDIDVGELVEAIGQDAIADIISNIGGEGMQKIKDQVEKTIPDPDIFDIMLEDDDFHFDLTDEDQFSDFVEDLAQNPDLQQFLNNIPEDMIKTVASAMDPNALKDLLGNIDPEIIADLTNSIGREQIEKIAQSIDPDVIKNLEDMASKFKSGPSDASEPTEEEDLDADIADHDEL